MDDGPEIPVDMRDVAHEARRVIAEHAAGQRCDWCKDDGRCVLLAGSRRVLRTGVES